MAISLNVAALRSEEDIETTLDNHARVIRGEPYDPPIVAWDPTTTKTFQDEESRPIGLVVDLSKIDPNAKHLIFWIGVE